MFIRWVVTTAGVIGASQVTPLLVAAQDVTLPASGWGILLDSLRATAQGLRVCLAPDMTSYAPGLTPVMRRPTVAVVPRTIITTSGMSIAPDCCMPGDTAFLDATLFLPERASATSRALPWIEASSMLEVVAVVGVQRHGIATGRHFVLDCSTDRCSLAFIWPDLADWAAIIPEAGAGNRTT
jgi:hypothetical protein